MKITAIRQSKRTEEFTIRHYDSTEGRFTTTYANNLTKEEREFIETATGYWEDKYCRSWTKKATP